MRNIFSKNQNNFPIQSWTHVYAAIFLLISIVMVVRFYKSPDSLIQDSLYKFAQLEEFAVSRNFQRPYNELSQRIDPETNFRVFIAPFEVHTQTGNYFVFPFLWVMINYPFFYFFGFYGIFIIPILSGLLSIYLLARLLGLLTKRNDLLHYTILFYLLCTPLTIYSSWFYEATICNVILYLSLYLIFKYKKGKLSYIGFLLNGFLIFFRIEIFYWSILIFGLVFLFRKKERFLFFRKLSLLTIPVFIFLFSHHYFYGTFLPLRAANMEGFTIAFRFQRLSEYLMMFLLYIPPALFLTIPILRASLQNPKLNPFRLRNSSHTIVRKFSLRRLDLYIFWAIVLLIFTLPILSPNQQGLDTTPRYFFPITPLLAFFCFKMFSHWKPKTAKLASISLIAFSFLYIYTFVKIVKSYTHNFPAILQKIDAHKSQVNIYYQDKLLIPGELMRIRDSQNAYFKVSSKEELLSLQERIRKQHIAREQISLFLMGETPDFIQDENVLEIDSGNIPGHPDCKNLFTKRILGT